jgi:outer membrane protein TolC
MTPNIGSREGCCPTAGKPRRALTFGAMALACALLAGCSAEYYRKSADNEVYKILAQKQKRALGADGEFTIEPSTADPLEGLPRRYQPLVLEAAQPGAPPPAAAANPPAIISLDKAIEIAIRNSSDYQSNKETVYLSALSLTLERFKWTPQFTALLTGKYNRADRDESYTGSSQFGVSQLLATGGTLTADLTTNLLQYTTGDPRTSAASLLTANFTQPLWRGAGQAIAQESLTQAERDVIYAVRTFARYHRTFAVSVATNYYRLLEQRSVAQNQYANYTSSIQSRQRAEKLAEASKLPPFQVDQTRQAELSAKVGWLSAQENYRSSLDQLKIQLGLRADANVDVDTNELTKLEAAGIVHPQLTSGNAVKQALALRLDLINQRDAVADAVRQVAVAANGLGPDISLVAAASVPSPSAENRPTNLRFEQGTYSVGANVNLPLVRTAQRNTYRQALISLDQSQRSLILLEDNIKLQVRDEWRTLQERKESYEIQRESVTLAERRVASTALLLDAGRSTARDLLDAQASLLSAKNDLIAALVDHTVARLGLWRDVETLLVTPEGSLEEHADAAEPATDKPVR